MWGVPFVCADEMHFTRPFNQWNVFIEGCNKVFLFRILSPLKKPNQVVDFYLVPWATQRCSSYLVAALPTFFLSFLIHLLVEKTRPLSVIIVIHYPLGVNSGLIQKLYTAFIQVLLLVCGGLSEKNNHYTLVIHLSI